MLACQQMDKVLEYIHAKSEERYEKLVVKDAQGRSVVRGVQHVPYPERPLQEVAINALVHRIYREVSAVF